MRMLLRRIVLLLLLVLPQVLFPLSPGDTLKSYTNHLIDLAGQSRGNPQKRVKMASDAVKYSNKLGDEKLRGEVLMAYGNALLQTNKFSEAIDSARKAADIFIRYGDSLNLAKIFNLLGSCYSRRAQYDKAIDYFDKTILVSQKLGDSSTLASGYNNMGIVYYSSNRPSNAKDYFLKGLNIYKKLNLVKNVAKAEGNLGLISLEEGNCREAMVWFDSSLQVRLQLRDTLMLASIYDNIGNAQEKLGDFKRSLDYYNLSSRYFKSLNSRHGITLSSIAIARIQLKLGNYAGAYKNLKLAQSIAITDQEDDLTMQCYRLLSDYYSKVGDNLRSRQMLEEYIRYFEKSFNQQTTSRIAEMQVQFENDRKEQDYRLLSAKLEMQQLQAKQDNRLVTFYSISAILLLVLLGITIHFVIQLRKRNRQIKLVNRQLSQFNDELEKMVDNRTKDLSEALEKVKELEKIKSAFLTNISHEIRTPLNGIVGLTQHLVQGDVPGGDRQQFGSLVHKMSGKLLGIVDNILELSKIETNQLDLHFTDYSINELLGEIYQTYASNGELLAKKLNLRFIKSLPDNQSVFSVDVYRVKRILINLIENAIKFTHSGSIEFGYYTESASTIKFFVKDTGIGIPPKVQTLVFERFYKHIPDDQNYEGTGIGLTLARGYAVAMGGRIEMESAAGQGSTFYFYLPKKDREQLSGNIGEKLKELWNSKTILVVEDDLISYQYVEALMHRTGARLIHVKNAEDAIEVCNINKNLNLILLDVQLPFMSGIDAANIIRQSNNKTPIIAQTAGILNNEGKECLNAGCNAFIAKPIDPDELFNLINGLIQ